MIKKENVYSKLKNINCITPLSYAGHGKGYICNILSQELNRKTQQLSFSDPIKKIIAQSFTNNKLTQLQKQTPEYKEKLNTPEDIYHYFEYLKNKRHDISVFQDLNMRDFMIFIMGNDFLLKADKEIKVKFACLDMLESLDKDQDLLFLADSTRYEEELLFAFGLNQSADPKAFLRNYIYSYKEEESINKIQSINLSIKMNFNLSEEDSKIINNITQKICEKIQETLQIEGDHQDFPNLKKQYLNSNDYSKLTEYGVIHIFRSLLPRKNYDSNINLEQEILDYNQFDQEELDFIKNNYKNYNIPFNQVNIHQYGYLRANPKDTSEVELSIFKPIAILNKPNLKGSDLIQQIEKIGQLQTNDYYKKQQHHERRP